MKKAATFFSFLFHPLIMPTIGIIILMFGGQYISYMPLQARKILVILAAVGTFALPALMVPVFLLRGSIHSIHMDKRRERIFPLTLTFVFYLLTFLLFQRIPVYRFIHAFILGSFLSVAVAMVVTLWWKISTHLLALGGLAALILYLSFYTEVSMLAALLLIILVAGITASSRVYLKAHTPAQVYAGFFAGFVVMMLTLLMY